MLYIVPSTQTVAFENLVSSAVSLN